MDDELRKAAQDFADSVDGYENDLPLSAIRAKGALRAALANNANAAPQQTVSVGEINEAWKVFKVWFGNKDWTVDDADNFRIIFGHGYNFGAARNTAPVPVPAPQPIYMFRRNGYDDSLMDDQPKPNPYTEGSAEWEDYKVGYEEGAAYCRLAYEGAPDPEY